MNQQEKNKVVKLTAAIGLGTGIYYAHSKGLPLLKPKTLIYLGVAMALYAGIGYLIASYATDKNEPDTFTGIAPQDK